MWSPRRAPQSRRPRAKPKVPGGGHEGQGQQQHGGDPRKDQPAGDDEDRQQDDQGCRVKDDPSDGSQETGDPPVHPRVVQHPSGAQQNPEHSQEAPVEGAPKGATVEYAASDTDDQRAEGEPGGIEPDRWLHQESQDQHVDASNGDPLPARQSIAEGGYAGIFTGVVGGPADPKLGAAAWARVSLDGEGNFSGVQITSINGQIIREDVTGGLYSIEANCHGSSSSSNAHSEFIVIDEGRQVLFLITDPGTVLAGTFSQQ